MEKVVINAGWAHCWSKNQREHCIKVIDLLNRDPNTIKTSNSLSSCAIEKTWDNGEFRITWKIDSSD